MVAHVTARGSRLRTTVAFTSTESLINREDFSLAESIYLFIKK